MVHDLPFFSSSFVPNIGLNLNILPLNIFSMSGRRIFFFNFQNLKEFLGNLKKHFFGTLKKGIKNEIKKLTPNIEKMFKDNIS